MCRGSLVPCPELSGDSPELLPVSCALAEAPPSRGQTGRLGLGAAAAPRPQRLRAVAVLSHRGWDSSDLETEFLSQSVFKSDSSFNLLVVKTFSRFLQSVKRYKCSSDMTCSYGNGDNSLRFESFPKP